MVPPQHKKFESQKKNRKDMMTSVIKTQHGKQTKNCATCQLDCEVARKADIEHWANRDRAGEPARYRLASCPKEDEVRVSRRRKLLK